MTSTAPSALPVNPAALAQRVARKLENYRGESAPIVLVSAAPVWPHDPILTTRDGTRLRVVACVSALAVWEQLSTHHDLPRVLLTSLGHHELGTGILSRVFLRRLIDMEPWGLVAESFGAQRHDPRLEAYPWAGRALVDATPAGGWPRLAGPVLERDVALRHLAAQRLHLDHLGIGPDDIDAQALLCWSMLPAAPQALTGLPADEREGLLSWLVDQAGPTVRVLAALLSHGRVDDALALGLVCQALWSASDSEAVRAQGRVDQYLGAAHFDDAAIRAFADASTATVLELLHAAGKSSADAPTARMLCQRVLDGAEDLLLGFAATGAARHSATLRSGFDYRLGRVAVALQRALDASAQAGASLDVALGAAGSAVDDLEAHHLASDYRHRVERAQMAVRLLRWLALAPEPGTAVDDLVHQHVNQWAFVDLALGHVWAGEDTHSELAAAYRAIYDRVRDRRRELDRTFAGRLAAWTRDGAQPGDVLTVETVLSRVATPLLREGGRPVLVIVIDAMTAAVAAELADEAASHGWVEYDPLAGAGSVVRRRGAVAALPTVTSVSRTSLLTATLRRGNQDDERVGFEKHPMWRGRSARLFHKGSTSGSAGEVLNEDLVLALSEPDTVVGVVINVVDDSLDHGRESADPGWRINHTGPLRTLLDHARYHGRAVILASDHGHVHERDGSVVPAGNPQSARHRTDAAPPIDAEVELIGARVVADEERIVALWDAGLRYLPRKAGYHGGASLAEVTTPVVALLHFGAAAPAGWRPLGPVKPAWWFASAQISTMDDQSNAPPAAKKPRRPVAQPTDAALFELAPPAATADPTVPMSLVDLVLASDIFLAQHASTPRKVPLPKVRGALAALVEANGVLPIMLVAERAGEQPARAIGLITTLQRILNVDNFAVLRLTDDSRTVRLDVALLCQQFGLPESAR